MGCGDSFGAAIVLGFVQQLPIPATLALANAVCGSHRLPCLGCLGMSCCSTVLSCLTSHTVGAMEEKLFEQRC